VGRNPDVRVRLCVRRGGNLLGLLGDGGLAVTFIDQARKVAEGATDAPWSVTQDEDFTSLGVGNTLVCEYDHQAGRYEDDNTEPNFALIAFMRNHWDAMVDVVEAVTAFEYCPFCGTLQGRGVLETRLPQPHYADCPLARLEAITKEGA
jgi:hypothetical protein